MFPQTAHQRCWFHKIGNVVNNFPKSLSANVKSDLNDIHHALSREEAIAALDRFEDKYGAKYERAVTCLTKDRHALLAFFDFPAEHWDHLRSSNPIKSVFATVRHRSIRTRGALSQKTAKLKVFSLIQGVKFRNGVEVIDGNETSAA